MVYYVSRLVLCWNSGFGYYFYIFLWFGQMLTPVGLYFQPCLPDDSNSKVVGNEYDLLVYETTNSISSVLRKEIEGKVAISKPKGSIPWLQVKPL